MNEKEKVPSPSNDILPYACVHCATPCASLYRRLSVSLSSIKTMNCSNCGQTVDPYIEREWLLVAIDCILLRHEAYRHVLFNVDEFKETPLRRAFQFLLAWAILDGYLKWETLRNDESSNHDEGLLQDTNFIFSLGTSSFLGMLVQWLAIFLYMKHLTKKTQLFYLSTKVLWALLLPSSFSVVTIFVLVWENTKTTRLLGSLLVASGQGIAVFVVSEDMQTPLVGLIAGVIWRLLVPTFWIQSSPCIGLEVDLLGAPPYSLCVT